MTDDGKLKVIIPPETLAQMEEDFDPEELQELLDMIQRLAASGKLLEQSQPLDMDALRRDEPEVYEQLAKRLGDIDDAGESFTDSRTLN